MTLDSQGSRSRTAVDAARIRFRRAGALLLMTLFLPGSAQLVAGNKKVGWIALRVTAVVVTLVLGGLALAYFNRGFALWAVFNSDLLWLVHATLFLLACGWAGLLIDAWRLGMPLDLDRPHRLVMAGASTTLCAITGAALLIPANFVDVQRDMISNLFPGGGDDEVDHGRYNILLAGGDSGTTRVGLRPDSMTIASIDADTGRTVLIGLPRNLENVPFPESSPMHKEFPKGFRCDGCYLNGVNTYAAEHDIYPADVANPGMQATQEAIEATTGLKINYYAMVNLQGFQDMVNAVGGLVLTVPTRVPIGGIGAPITGWVPSGHYRLNGEQALWFARSRVEDDDYARMARQKCVMNAMLQQLSPKEVLFNANAIAKSSEKLLSTNIPASKMDTFADLALKARSLPVSTVSLVPPKIETWDPDFDEIRSMVQTAIDKSERMDEGSSDNAAAKSGHKGKKKKSNQSGSASSSDIGANSTKDLGASC